MTTARLLQAAGPLAGASVIVTRPAASAAPLKRRIRALGGNAIALPVLALRRVVDTAAAKATLRQARDAEIVVFVSPAAVKFAFASNQVRLVRAHTLPTNAPSVQVLARCGFERTGEVVDPEDGLVIRWERAKAFT